MTMEQSADRILTTHTGSLPRPPELVAMLVAREAGEPVDVAAFRDQVHQAVEAVVNAQVAAGVDIVNDGEQGRFDFASYARYRLTGFDSTTAPFRGFACADIDDYPEFRELRDAQVEDKEVPACGGPITYDDDAVMRDAQNLTEAAAGRGVAGTFLTSVAPGELSLFLPNRFYPTEDEYLSALVDALRTEYEAIHRAGHLVQLDAPDLGLGFHVYYRGSTVAEFRRHVEQHVEAINAATAAIPPEAMRLHFCYGPEASPHHHDIEMRHVVDLILKARPAGLNFEAANCRHEHEWRVFEDVKLPEGKYLIPGVIDITTNRIEHPALVAERVTRLARVVGRENVVAGTDCGFATGSLMRTVLPSIVWAKLRSLAEGAELASRELW
jgi:5-methyltetrahydropteroyltriglutamate--homocysteine methyltransferase